MSDTIMAHLVVGYPTLEESFDVARGLVDGGAALLEVQFPFSDPTADGPVIQDACRVALEQGVRTADGFDLVRRIRAELDVPLFVMSYANTIFQGGVEHFISDCIEASASGIIAPDLPPDSDEGLYRTGRDAGLEVMPVIVPTTTPRRMRTVREVSGARRVYAALRRGITGAHTVIDEANLVFLRDLRALGLDVLAGFGISTREQVVALSQEVQGVIVGSALLRALEARHADVSPYDAVRTVMEQLTGHS